jgi:carnitine-CoA ligase
MAIEPHRAAQALTDVLTAEGELVTERLDHWAAATPDRIFLHYGEDDLTYTYAEFGTATDSIAGNLAAHGVTNGDRVSVFSTNPLAAALLLFGIWKAGAVYAPVNFSFTGRLLAYEPVDHRFPVLSWAGLTAPAGRPEVSVFQVEDLLI